MRLESFTHRVLRDLPPRQAPQSLQTRVFAELERRAALPWWRKSFLHWPMPARALFVLASYFFVRIALSGISWVSTTLEPATARVQETASAINTVSSVSVRLFQLVPMEWIYGGVLFGAVIYVSLFALGALAYRTLYAPTRTGSSAK